MPVADNKNHSIDSNGSRSAQNGGSSGQQKHGSSSRRGGSNKRSGSKSMVRHCQLNQSIQNDYIKGNDFKTNRYDSQF